MVSRVVEALLLMGESRPGQVILQDLYNIDSLTAARSEDYDPVREAFSQVFGR